MFLLSYGDTTPCPCKMVNLVDVSCVFLSPLPNSLTPTCFLRYNIEMKLISNPAMASKCSSQKRSHTFFILNQKLAMIKLGEEGMWKGEID